VKWTGLDLIWIYGGDIRMDAAGTARAVVSVTAASTGKRYAEVVFDTVVSPGSPVPKLMMGATKQGGTFASVPDTNGATLNFDGKVFVEEVVVATDGPTFTGGEVGMVAVDPSNGKIWLGKVGTGWYGGGDPAAGTSPVATLGANSYYVGWGESRSSLGVTPIGCKTTLRTQSSQFTGTIPSGFSAWYTG
jgi:hypothetical protein